MWRRASCWRASADVSGERYILGAENLTLQQILETLAGIVTRKARAEVRIPYAVAYAAGVASTAWADVTGKEPRAPLDGCGWRGRRCGCGTIRPHANWDIPPGPARGSAARAL